MPEEETTTTINEEPAAPSAQVKESGDLVSTVPTPELTPPSEETIKTEDAKDSKDDGKETEKEPEKEVKAKEPEPKAAESEPETDKSKGDDARLDKHPRFKAIIDANRDLRNQNQDLSEKVNALLQKFEADKDVKSGKESFFEGKSNEDLTEMFDENPQKFLAQFADSLKGQFKEEFTKDMQQIRAQETQEERYRRNYEEFAAKNSDFLEMWDSGEIPTFMDGNPGHNAISAYYAITEPSRAESNQKQIDEAVKKAVEEERKKQTKNLKAKRSVTYLPSEPRGTGGKDDAAPELNDSKKFGGTNAVLANRLWRRRQQGG